MNSNINSIITSAIAGAIAGAIVTLLIIQSPTTVNQIKDSLNIPQPQSDNKPLPPAADVSDYEKSVIEAVQKAKPAVVAVIITQDVPIFEQYFEEGTPFDPFSDFFGDGFFSPFRFQRPQLREKGTEKREVGGGSGFIVSSDGYIITNKHVVDQEDAEYTVFLNDGTKYNARIIARDPVNDIAVLKIDTSNLPFLEFADSSQLHVGQTSIAIGNALSEFQNTVSVGVISGLSRSITAGGSFGQAEQLDEVIQTDAAINPGNSGGPLLDLTGKVIGVNVAMALGSENIGFALPSNLVKTVVDSVQKTGSIKRPYLGVRYVNITPALKKANKLPTEYGALVTRGETTEDLAVVPGSPANKMGIVEGDIILEIDGQKLDEDSSLAAIIRKKSIGDTVSLKILSKGEEKTVHLKLEEFPE